MTERPSTAYEAVLDAVGTQWTVARDIHAKVGYTEGTISRSLHRAMREGLIERREREEYQAARYSGLMVCGWPDRYEYRAATEPDGG